MFITFYKQMRIVVVAVCCLVLLVLANQAAHAQDDSYNPYLIQGIVDQTGSSNGETLIPAEFGGTGFVRFDVGNLGLDPLTIPPPGGNPNDIMTLIVTLSKGIPDNVDPLAALSGPGVAWFNWSYDPSITTYSATQIATIPGQSRENITIAYKVTENSFLSASPTISNGFNVNLQPPGYTNPQPTDDDAVSSYTYVEASDYGDIPTTGISPDGAGTNNYGSADHIINLAKSGGSYTQYMYLGASVDPESTNQDSDDADGDDLNQTNSLDPSDDENGVTFPTLETGAAVNIPVTVTIEDSGFGFLNAWIDWDGNGSFDGDEQITANNAVFTPGTSTINLPVTVPTDAITTAPTYARFRFGNPAGSSGSTSYGEVEDYLITINAPVPVTLSYFEATNTDGELTFDWQTATETGNMGFNLFVESNDSLQQINDALILTQELSSMQAADYSFSANVSGDTFYIEDIDIFGKAKRRGPFALGQAYGSKAVEIPVDWAAINAEHDAKTAARNSAAGKDAQARTQQASAASSSSGPLLKLGVSQSGLYRLTHADLLATGVDLSGSNNGDIALTMGGVAVPITVTGSGGLFDATSSIEFYGQAIDTIHSKENVYTLQLDAALAVRAAIDNSTPSGSPAGYYLETLALGDDNTYDVVSPSDSPWYDSYVYASSSSASKSYAIDVDNYVSGAAPAALNVDLLGLTVLPQAPDHHVVLDIGGTTVGDVTFDGRTVYPLTTDLAEGVVQNGLNTLQVTLPNDLGLPYDIVAIDTYSLTYPRSFVAKADGQLTFTSSGTAFQVDGLPSADVLVYRVDADGSLTQLTNVAISGSSGNHSVNFAGSGSEATYLVYSSDHLLTPAMSAARPFTDITTGTADYLMISHADFINDLAPLVAFHESNGLTVKVVDVADVYDQYSTGIFDPQAIKDYLQYAAANMGVEYVLLVGGDTYDYADNLSLGSVSFIPSPYMSTGSIVNFAPVDPLYADVDGDLVPDLKLGRFPVRTSAELAQMINKTLLYAGADYKETAVFSADIDDGPSYTAISNDFASHLPANWQIETAYLDEVDVATARTTLIDSINSGVGLTNYVGHSGANEWTWAGLFNATDAGSLTNVGQPTAVTQWGCWNTYHVKPQYQTLGHQFMQGNTGAAIVMGAATLTSAASEEMLGQYFMDYLAQGNMTFGEALQLAKVDLQSSSPGLLDVQMGYTLLGDPALSLAKTTSCAPAPTPTNVTIAKDGSKVDLAWDDMGVSADHYEVWDSGVDNYYFSPAGDCAASADCTVVSGTSISLENGDINKAFVVLAVSSCGEKSSTASAQRVGVFHFVIEPGTP